MQGEEFTISLRDLYQKGGKYQKAAQTVQGIWGRAKLDEATVDETFRGVARTNHGEHRIPHCVKFDLTGFARLVVVINDNVCLFLYAGEHDAVDRWLDRNRGLDFVAKRKDATLILDKVRLSDLSQGREGRISSETDLSAGPLINLLPQRYRTKLLHDLAEDTLADVMLIESVSNDDDIFEVCTQCADQNQTFALMDVLLSLKSGDVTNAKSRIDLYCQNTQPVTELDSAELKELHSSDAAVLLSDVDATLFQHFVETASFEKWMLYLHPSQRHFVNKDFAGPARVAGVSGSGKTCVVVHRALRLADKYSPEPVLIVTLSAALASLISQLIDAHMGLLRPPNIKVISIFDLCFDKLTQFEPMRRDYYTRTSIKKNPHAVSEHFEEVWHEYFMCENNNHDADVLFDIVQMLNARGVYGNEYLRQEFDYVRSTFPPSTRDGYLEMERSGRIVPLEGRFRQQVLEGLSGWERKMNAVGVIDDMGIVAALYRHRDKLEAEYRAALIDESQDLGTLEMEIIRRLVSEGENDLFLCSDAAQTIYTKSTDYRLAGIDLGGRFEKLSQNYRNSRQILTAAHEVLTRALTSMPKGAVNFEVMAPEYASFSSPKPLLLSATSLQDELHHALGFVDALMDGGPATQRYCIAVCGFGQSAIASLGEQLRMPVLSANADVRTGRVFLSDLELTKGFEFDAVVLINCSESVIPHPNLPAEESFRDLCRMYVAMTRAKTQLVVSYANKMSPFIEAARECFVEAAFSEYCEPRSQGVLHWPAQIVPQVANPEIWARDGKGFLKSRDAVGLERTVQEEVLEHVTGHERVRGTERKQLEWKTFGSFVTSLGSPRVRAQVISEEAWERLSDHVNGLRRTRQ